MIADLMQQHAIEPLPRRVDILFRPCIEIAHNAGLRGLLHAARHARGAFATQDSDLISAPIKKPNKGLPFHK
jgi:hypothetical protein